MEAGAQIDLDVTDVAHGGVFVGRHEGRVVFVPDAIPGERVRARISDTSHKAFWRADVLEVLDASEHRRPHVWREADVDVAPEDRAGGADFGHIDLAHQRALKQHVLDDALRRMGGLELPTALRPVPPLADGTGEETADGTGWRTRVSLHVDDEGRVGPFAARSHRVIPVSEHPLATDAVAAAAARLTGGKPGRIDLVQPADGRVRVLPRPESRRRGRPDPKDPAREVIVERVGAREFRVDAGGFWQVHRLAAHALTTLVAAGIRSSGPLDPDAVHLDLYGGVGLFAAVLGDLGGGATRVTTVESDPRATDHAASNLAEWLGARAETGRVDRWLTQLRGSASERELEKISRGVVVLDPPRSGAGREVVESLADLGPERIVYVACDPVALARDLKTFAGLGYETPRVDAVDLFPNSHHIESVAVLSRAARR